GLLGGAITDAVRRRYRQAGYQTEATASSPDHIGHELGLLAFLCAAEAEAHEDREQGHVERLQRRQSVFLQHHLLRWLPPLVLALRDHQLPFYARVGQMTLQLVQDQMADLHGSTSIMPDPLPPAPHPLRGAESSLSDIARFLVTPLHSGLYLSRETIGALARRFDLPRGFGSRKQLLLNTLRSAAQYERLDDFLNALQTLATEWADGYAALSSGPSAAFVALWQERVIATRRMLREMQAQRETHAQSEYNKPE
ncbi:MAG TPA: molecular chaperone TorD family protein, partial [Candidatus Sulfomarinibacteraceae bacterium]|nr:molecular chaperone TorD family protein [Candidatus Sulfomarinibacteraceae bacterium]